MEIPRHWRLKKQRYALIGEVCSYCEGKIFPPRDVCPECGKRGESEAEFADEKIGAPSDELVMQAFLAKTT